jgi:hypothetical protein
MALIMRDGGTHTGNMALIMRDGGTHTGKVEILILLCEKAARILEILFVIILFYSKITVICVTSGVENTICYMTLLS